MSRMQNFWQKKDNQFIQLESSPEIQQDYQYKQDCFSKRVLYAHCVKALRDINQRIEYRNKKNQPLMCTDEKDITPEDDSIYIAKNAYQNFSDVLFEQQSKQVTPGIIMRVLLRQFKKQLALILGCFAIESLCKIGFSIAIQALFMSVSPVNEVDNHVISYLIVLLCGVIWYIGIIGRCQAFYQSSILVTRMMVLFKFLFFARLSQISQHTSNKEGMGKIINIFYNDLHTIELKSIPFLNALIAPLAFSGIIALLLTRFGWSGILILGFIVLIVPIQTLIAKINSTFVKKNNVNKDSRTKLFIQCIQGIRYIKMYCMQKVFYKLIQSIRAKESRLYFILSIGRSLEKVINTIGVTVCGFAYFLFLDLTQFGNELTTSKIFSTIYLMFYIKTLISFSGTALNFYFELGIIFERFCNILNIQDLRMIELDQKSRQRITQFEAQFQKVKQSEKDQLRVGDVKLKNFSAYWQQKAKPTLQKIQFTAHKGEFIGITGKIGSGKSTLLAAILDQIPFYSGTIVKKGSLAYVQQQPVIFSGTIRENILFGRQFNQQKYQNALQISCFITDLQQLHNHENTLIGQRGITLSGGQKVRLSLARAIYTDSDIYLLDDPISAVDSKVAKQIYDRLMGRMRKQKTIILVTHQISYLYGCDKVIIMQDGKILKQGVPSQLVNELKYLQSVQNQNKKSYKQPEKDTGDNKNIVMNQQLQQSNISEFSQISQKQDASKQDNIPSTTNQQNKQTVTLRTLSRYIFFSKINYFLFPVSVIFFILAELCNIAYLRILAQYDNNKNYPQQGTTTYTKGILNINRIIFDDMHDFWFCLGIILVFNFVFQIIKYLLAYLILMRSNNQIHKKVLVATLRTSVSYFDVKPSAQITSRYSGDFTNMDSGLPFIYIQVLQSMISALVLFTNILSINIYFVTIGIVNVVLIIFLMKYFNNVILKTRKLQSNQKIPVSTKFTQMMQGLTQIRIYNIRSIILKQFSRKLNNYTRTKIYYHLFFRAFGTFIAYFSGILIFIGWILGIGLISSYNANLYKVSVLFLIQFSVVCQWTPKQITNFQRYLLSVQKVFTLLSLQPQKQLVTQYDLQNQIPNKTEINQQNKSFFSASQKSKKIIHKSWPSDPSIKIQNFSMGYRPELPFSIKNLTFQIKSSQKVGIVGRTGAGKSSIIQSLLRLYEPNNGSIYFIGGYNALDMGLHSLRGNISVIPQTPFLFNGSVRKNLDPFEIKSDSQIWQALQNSGLKEAVQNLPDKLDTISNYKSQIFSVGQKQLICLARALLSKNSFLILDEATANVDLGTDNQIQNCIKTKFKDTTVLTIAHRLTTVADYDKIIVMENGTIAEFGTPYQLINKNGLFSQMVENTGKNAIIIKKIAQQSFMKKINNK